MPTITTARSAVAATGRGTPARRRAGADRARGRRRRADRSPAAAARAGLPRGCAGRVRAGAWAAADAGTARRWPAAPPA
ncbi:hypothetical protein AN399_24405, partial [Pseudomonas aeruginosa]